MNILALLVVCPCYVPFVRGHVRVGHLLEWTLVRGRTWNGRDLLQIEIRNPWLLCDLIWADRGHMDIGQEDKRSSMAKSLLLVHHETIMKYRSVVNEPNLTSRLVHGRSLPMAANILNMSHSPFKEIQLVNLNPFANQHYSNWPHCIVAIKAVQERSGLRSHHLV